MPALLFLFRRNVHGSSHNLCSEGVAIRMPYTILTHRCCHTLRSVPSPILLHNRPNRVLDGPGCRQSHGGFFLVVAGGRRSRRVHISLKGPFTRGGGKRRKIYYKKEKEAASSAPVALEVYNLPPSFRCKFSHNPNHLQSNPHQ